MKLKSTHLSAALILGGAFLWHGETGSDLLIQTQVNAEQSVPQGQDPPGADEPGAPKGEKNDGVITPPPTGDEEIHTTVPNPDAGHDEEVIPPPGTPENAPNLDPR
jgi:hypothetical protein